MVPATPRANTDAGQNLRGLGIRADRWLAEVIGRPAFRLTVPAQPESGAAAAWREALRSHAAEHPNAFYDAKVPIEAVPAIRALTGAGLFLADVNLTFRRESAPEGIVPPAGSGIAVAPFAPADREGVLEIAGSCFRYSRFHLDPLFSKEIADRVKRAWIKSCIEGERGDRLWVARWDGRPVGFLAALTDARPSERVRIIDLIGVDSRTQGRGIGRALVNQFIAESSAEGSAMEIGTQAANGPSARLHEGCGFRLVRAQAVLHGHAGRTILSEGGR